MDVDLEGITRGLAITDVFFILLIFSMFSVAIIKAFQQKFRGALLFAGLGIFFCFVFYFVLKIWFVTV